MNEFNVVMENQFLGNSLGQWLTALGTFLVVWFVLGFITQKVSDKIAAMAKNTNTRFDDILAEVLGSTKGFFIFGLALYFGLKVLHFSERFHDHLNSAVVVLFLLQVGFWGSAGIHFWLENVLKKRASVDTTTATTMGLIGFGARTVFFVIIALMILSNMGVDITALVAGLGIGGIAIGLALQNILGDLFASLVIVLDKPFVVGDAINIGTFNGTIEYIGIKTTRVRSTSGEQLIFSNGDIQKNTIRNYKRMEHRRIEFNINASYGTPVKTVAEIPGEFRRIIEAQPKVRFDRAHFQSLGDSSLVFNIVYIMLEADYLLYMDTQQRINLAIMELFENRNIEFSTPSTKMVWDGKVGAPPLASASTSAPAPVN